MTISQAARDMLAEQYDTDPKYAGNAIAARREDADLDSLYKHPLRVITRLIEERDRLRSCPHVLAQAKGEIEDFRSLLAEAGEVLEPFGAFYDCIDREYPDDEDYYSEVGEEGHHGLKPCDFRKASSLSTKIKEVTHDR